MGNEPDEFEVIVDEAEEMDAKAESEIARRTIEERLSNIMANTFHIEVGSNKETQARVLKPEPKESRTKLMVKDLIKDLEKGNRMSEFLKKKEAVNHMPIAPVWDTASYAIDPTWGMPQQQRADMRPSVSMNPGQVVGYYV